MNMKDEEICGFQVTAEMKKVWAVQLDLLRQFIDVCEKNNLQYFLIAGSLLGAVRHKGFIPWDDDIDVGMLREDYDKLIKLADQFKEPYFLQTPYNDKIFRGHAQLRNSNTTAILKVSNKNAKYNQGIFIDIFPHDNVPKDVKERKKLKREIEKKRKLMTWYWNDIKRTNKIKNILQTFMARVYFIFHDYKECYREFEKLCAKYSDEEDGMVSNICLVYDRPDRYDKNFFRDLIEADFQGIKVKIPREYDTILREQYGDYHKFVIGTTAHGGVIFDPDRSYREYVKK